MFFVEDGKNESVAGVLPIVVQWFESIEGFYFEKGFGKRMSGKIQQSIRLSFLLLVGWSFSAFASEESLPKSSLQPASLAYCGVRDLQENEPNLTGSGVAIAAVCRSMMYVNGLPQDDYRFNMAHASLRGGRVFFEDGSDGFYGLSPHETAVGGLLIGLDFQGNHPLTGPFVYKGVCPEATVEVFEFWRFVSLTVFGGKPFSADVLTLSLGDFYEDWWTRGIERLAQKTGVLVVASAGNGLRVSDQVLYPAGGANVLAVGVVQSQIEPDGEPSLAFFSLPHRQISSFGPTADGRSKPDLVAPGRALVPSVYDASAYEAVGDYSSLATPLVSGTAALLFQKIYQTPAMAERIRPETKNCVMRAILMTSARKLPWWHKGHPGREDDDFVPLDWLQGAGLLDAKEAYALLTEGARPEEGGLKGWDNPLLDAEHPEAVYSISVPAGQEIYLTATAVWNRDFEDRFPFRALPEEDGDLRLELWRVEPNQAEKILVDVCDSPVDTVEHLYVRLPDEAGSYELAVRFSQPQAVQKSAGRAVGLAWSVGPDRSRDNPWWYDLNEDGRIDQTDKVIYQIFEKGQSEILGEFSLSEALGLSPDRIELLRQQWSDWRSYLGLWAAPEDELMPSNP